MYQFTRTVSSALLTAAILVTAPMAAIAATFDFSFSGFGFSGSGEFTSNSPGPAAFLITGISGASVSVALAGSSTFLLLLKAPVEGPRLQT
jgi:hypothetical protein